MTTAQEVSTRKCRKKDIPSGYVLVFLSLLTQQTLRGFFLWTGFPLILYIPQNYI